MLRILTLFFPVLLFLFFLFNSKNKKQQINGVNLVSPAQKVDSLDFSKLQRINTAWVGVVPYGFSRQGEPKVSFDHSRQWWGERSEGTRELIKLAQCNGYKVMLKPHIWMMGGWIGDFDLLSEEDWIKWELDYEKYILNYARVAAEAGVDMLCIGTEYKIATVKRPQYWYALILKIKEVYHGPLTYAANWDNYENISFWDQLDYIGVDAYFPLVQGEHPTIESMENAWIENTADLKRVSDKFSKPILFTEYGYQSVNGAAGEHWTVKKERKYLNMSLQSEAYQCLYNTIWKEDWMAGGFLWKWHLHDDRGGLQNPDWTPQNKPVESVIYENYGR
ncbi:MAG: hypothetical protein ACI93L_000602 [Cyclobacteriaceae bacterium]|jgi:hypothetical protein